MNDEEKNAEIRRLATNLAWQVYDDLSCPEDHEALMELMVALNLIEMTEEDE